jgi:ADP-ribosyl-[dinitrogen reductase] hydrolase
MPLSYYPDIEQAVAFAAESPKTTHGAEECLDACACLYSRQLSGFEW